MPPLIPNATFFSVKLFSSEFCAITAYSKLKINVTLLKQGRNEL
jgi:hypothetical protein